MPKKSIHAQINDSWASVLGSLGSSKDKSQNMTVGTKAIINDIELTNVWFSESIGKKIVYVVADDMTRKGWNFTGDDDGKLKKATQALKLWQVVTEALYWARLYGGALIVADVPGSGDLESPLPENHGGVTRLTVYDRTNVRINDMDLYAEDDSAYGDPEIFEVTPLYGGQTFKVHESRCAIFKGSPIPRNAYSVADNQQRFWGVSVLQTLLEELGFLGSSYQGVVNLLQEFSIGKMKIAGLGDMIAENDRKALEDRMTIIAMQKSIINAVLLGESEDYLRDTINLSGVPDALEKLWLRVAAAANIPMTKLTGQQVSGLSNNDDTSLTAYYADIEAKQAMYLYTPLSRLAKIINGGVKALTGEDAESPGVEFKPPWTPPASQAIKMLGELATACEKFAQLGVLHPEEIRDSVFKGDGLTFDITLKEEYNDDLLPTKNPAAAQPAKPPAQGEDDGEGEDDDREGE